MVSREAGLKIAKIHHLLERISFKLQKKLGVTNINAAQGRVLYSLSKEDHVPIHTLVTNTKLSKSTLTLMLDRLSKENYISRERSQADRRKVLVSITEKGKKIIDSYEQLIEKLSSIFYRNFNEEDIKKFESLLNQALSNLIKFEDRFENSK
jgi:DNA-binding MarR family transcriptional regulator